MSRTVLVPVDGSPLSFDVLLHACRVFTDAEIVAYHVVDLFRPDYGTLEDADSTLFLPLAGGEEEGPFCGMEVEIEWSGENAGQISDLAGVKPAK